MRPPRLEPPGLLLAASSQLKGKHRLSLLYLYSNPRRGAWIWVRATYSSWVSVGRYQMGEREPSFWSLGAAFSLESFRPRPPGNQVEIPRGSWLRAGGFHLLQLRPKESSWTIHTPVQFTWRGSWSEPDRIKPCSLPTLPLCMSPLGICIVSR